MCHDDSRTALLRPGIQVFILALKPLPISLNENVPGAESAADMALQSTVPDHAGAEAG